MNTPIHVFPVHVAQIVNVVLFMNMPSAPVHRVILAVHQIVVQSALSALNVLKIAHVSIRNVLIRAHQLVANMLVVK